MRVDEIIATKGEPTFSFEFFPPKTAEGEQNLRGALQALREMEPAAKMYGRIVSLSNAALKGELPEEAKELSIPEAMDEMIRWFCILFGNQFTPDDVLDYYPVDRLMHDIALALMAVQTQTTSILDEFPTKAAQAEKEAEQPQTQTA